MKTSLRGTLGLVAAFGAGLAIGLAVSSSTSALAQAEKSSGSTGRVSVVDTEGTNLLAVDHQTNTLYFYTVDRDEPPGSDLKLRGAVDLSQVGRPVITPKLYKEGAKTDASASERR